MNNLMRWDRNYAACVSFGEEHGHLSNLPSTNREICRVSNWLRLQNKRTQMTNDQKEKFDAQLALYELNQRPGEEQEREVWDHNYKKLLVHHEKYGAVSIDDDKTLNEWIHYQRQRVKQGLLSAERFMFQLNGKRKETSFSAPQIKQWGHDLRATCRFPSLSRSLQGPYQL
jgi:hypothetical protein